jgi:ActR/RegA family two-component response regulator
MNEEKLTQASEADEIDYSGRPFGYQDTNNETAMICEHDPVVRQKINDALKSLDYNVIESMTFKEVLKYSNFQTFNIIVVDEKFDTDTGGIDNVLYYLNNLSMSTRRKIFVV